MNDFENRLDILEIGYYILYGCTINEEFKKDNQKNLTTICNDAYQEAENSIKKTLKNYEINDNNKIIQNIIKELTEYGAISEITGFCKGIKAGIKLYIELAVK